MNKINILNIYLFLISFTLMRFYAGKLTAQVINSYNNQKYISVHRHLNGLSYPDSDLAHLLGGQSVGGSYKTTTNQKIGEIQKYDKFFKLPEI